MNLKELTEIKDDVYSIVRPPRAMVYIANGEVGIHFSRLVSDEDKERIQSKIETRRIADLLADGIIANLK